MTFKAVLSILLAGSMCVPALAETNWVERFLSRYHTPQIPLQAPPPAASPAPTLADLTRNGAISLTTEDIVRLLLENNRDVIVNRLTPVSSLYQIGVLGRPFEPNFHAGASVSRTSTPSRSQLTGAASLSQLTHDYRVGVDQALQTGTEYSVDFDLNRNSSNSAFNTFNPSFNGAITYAVTQHVLRDFGREANAHQIRVARNTEKTSELQFELQIIDLVAQAQQAYWDLQFANEDLKVKQRSLDLASKTLHDNQIQVDIGTLAPIDLVQAEAEVAQRNEDVITGKYNIDQLQDQMKKVISSETDPGLILTPLNLIEPLRQPGAQSVLPLTQAIQSALENRPELKQADYDIANQDVNVRFTKNQLLPVLDLNANYTQSGLGGTQTRRSGLGDTTTIVQIIPGGVGDVFSQLFGFNFTGYTAGFTLQIPIRNRAAHSDYDRAINEKNLSTMRKAATAQRVVLEVRNAYTQVEMQDARVNTAKTSRELAERRLDAEQKKFELGTSTVRFVLEEQRNLAQAETDEVSALVNYTKALVAYDRAIGNTLQRNNIEIDQQLPSQLRSGQGGPQAR
jgi:outer membrane protein TolC